MMFPNIREKVAIAAAGAGLAFSLISFGYECRSGDRGKNNSGNPAVAGAFPEGFVCLR
jgi:hypothetical protein